jgi:hypothetical protein
MDEEHEDHQNQDDAPDDDHHADYAQMRCHEIVELRHTNLRCQSLGESSSRGGCVARGLPTMPAELAEQPHRPLCIGLG